MTISSKRNALKNRVGNFCRVPFFASVLPAFSERNTFTEVAEKAGMLKRIAFQISNLRMSVKVFRRTVQKTLIEGVEIRSNPLIFGLVAYIPPSSRYQHNLSDGS